MIAMQSVASPNHDSRDGQAVDILLLHYTGMESGGVALERLCDPQAKVSAHYLIEEDGRLFQLVAEERRAWHAGVAAWQGATNINARSIGIELVNPGHEFGYREFPVAQMQSLTKLCHGILARHAIVPARVLGHSDVAPTRKEDPGELFDWQGLAAAGIGLWPNFDKAMPDEMPASNRLTEALARYGYGLDPADPGPAITAFQRHFRPRRCDGVFDPETAGRLFALLEQTGLR